MTAIDSASSPGSTPASPSATTSFRISGTERLRVLQLVTGDDQVAGVQKHAAWLAAGSRHEHLLCLTPAPRYLEWLLQEGLEPRVVRGFGDLREAISSFRPHIVHAHLGKALVYARAAQVLDPGLATLYTQHIYIPASDHDRSPAGLLRRVVVRHCESSCDRVVAVSRAVALACEKRVPGARVTVIPNGIRPPFATNPKSAVIAAKRIPTDAQGRFVLAGVARLESEKQPHLYLRLAELLDDPRFRIVVYGEGSLGPSLRDAALVSRSATKVEFAGWVSGVARHLGDATLGVHFGAEEAFSLALIEILNAGLPLVAMNYTSVTELARSACARIAPPGDVATIARHVRNICGDPALYRALSEGAFERSLDFGLRAWISATDDLASGVAAERAARRGSGLRSYR